MEKKHLRMIVLQDAEMICKHLCLLRNPRKKQAWTGRPAL